MSFMTHITRGCPDDNDCQTAVGKALPKCSCEHFACEPINPAAKEDAWWNSLTLDEKIRVYILLK